MVNVVKRHGVKEEFIPEKIVVSVSKVGAPVEVAREVAKTIEEKVYDGIPTEEIREAVISVLKERNSEWVTSWILYEKSIKKRRE